MPGEDLEILRSRAFTALGEGRYDDARRLFTIILRSDPDDCDAAAGLMEAHIRLGDVEAARSLAARECDSAHFLLVRAMISTEDEMVQTVISALSSMGSSPSLHLKRLAMEMIERAAAQSPGEVLSAVCDMKGEIAVEAVRRILQHFESSDMLDSLSAAVREVDSPLLRDIIEERFSEYLRSERFPMALRYADCFDFLDRKRLATSVLEAAETSREYGHLDDAVSLYSLLMEIDGSDAMRRRVADTLLRLAKNLRQRGDHSRSLALLRQVMGLGRSDVREEFDEIGHALVKEGKYEEALEVFREMSSLFDGFNIAYHVKNIANFLRDDGEYREAVRFYRIVREYDPDFDIREQYVHIGDALLKEGRYSEALEYYRMAGSRSAALIGRARCLEHLDRTEEASRLFVMARKLWPDDMRVLREWCEFLESRGRLTACLRSAERALESEPDARWARDMFRRVAEQLIRKAEVEKRFFEAFLLYQRYLRVFPDDDWALERRELCLTVLKGKDRKAWKKAVSMMKQ
jgi:tetratricopeptide (TPR) repeat protein